MVLRGSLMRFKMSWYECGLKRDFNEMSLYEWGFMG